MLLASRTAITLVAPLCIFGCCLFIPLPHAQGGNVSQTISRNKGVVWRLLSATTGTELHASMSHSTWGRCLQAHAEHKSAWTNYIASGTIRMFICMLSCTCTHQHLKMPTYVKKRPYSATKVSCGLSQFCEPSFHNLFHMRWTCWTRCALRATYNSILLLNKMESCWTHVGLSS